MATDFDRLRATFRRLNPHMIRMYRWTFGALPSALPPVTGKIMLLTHVGRRSGRRMLVPVNYAVIDEDVWCATHAHAEWLRNIRATPEVEVRLPLRRARRGVARTFPLDADHVAELRRVLRNSGFAAARYAGVHPRTDPDDALLTACRDYHLLQIHRAEHAPHPEKRSPDVVPRSHS